MRGGGGSTPGKWEAGLKFGQPHNSRGFSECLGVAARQALPLPPLRGRVVGRLKTWLQPATPNWPPFPWARAWARFRASRAFRARSLLSRVLRGTICTDGCPWWVCAHVPQGWARVPCKGGDPRRSGKMIDFRFPRPKPPQIG